MIGEDLVVVRHRLSDSFGLSSLTFLRSEREDRWREKNISQYRRASGAWSSPSVSQSSTLISSWINCGSVRIRLLQVEKIRSRAVHHSVSFSEIFKNHLTVFHHGIRSFTPGIILNFFCFATSKNDLPVSGLFACNAGSATIEKITSFSEVIPRISSQRSSKVFLVT